MGAEVGIGLLAQELEGRASALACQVRSAPDHISVGGTGIGQRRRLAGQDDGRDAVDDVAVVVGLNARQQAARSAVGTDPGAGRIAADAGRTAWLGHRSSPSSGCSPSYPKDTSRTPLFRTRTAGVGISPLLFIVD